MTGRPTYFVHGNHAREVEYHSRGGPDEWRAVSEPMGAGAIDEILRRYPSYEAYFADEFGLDAARLKALRDFYLE